jgi:threonine dehydrogenase-like Zn-dependent dehydrogenase
MRAVVMQSGNLSVEDFPIPQPGPGEVLVKTLACGICGSDIHCLAHGRELLDSARKVAGVDLFGFDDKVILGHEICAEVLEYGPDCRKTLPPGARAVSVPFLMRPEPASLIFGTPQSPGGYAEYMLLSEDFLIPVPDHVPDDLATLAEPLAVAIHAVRRSNLGVNDVPIVIGCGPIGLAVIAVLRMRGIGPIVAADFSPSRRAMAKRIGADVVVDPRETSPYDSWKAVAAAAPGGAGRQTQMFPGHAYRQSVVFECVGVPGMIQQILNGAAPCSKIVVAGLCMELDQFYPSYGIIKEVDIIFCIAFAMEEYAEAFGLIAAGKLDVGTLITGHVALDGVKDAFNRLKDPEQDVKIVIVP